MDQNDNEFPTFDKPWRFVGRSQWEMDVANNPVHQEEHAEFAKRATDLVKTVMEAVEAAPCPGAAAFMLETLNSLSVAGVVELNRQMTAHEAAKDKGEAPADDPTRPLPDIWNGLFNVGADPAT